MFEESVLDNAGWGRSSFSLLGPVVQAGIVAGLFLFPLVSPKILSVVAPKALIYLPLAPVRPPEVVAEAARGAMAAGANAPVVARPAARVFRAPSAMGPVTELIDAPGDVLASLVDGSGADRVPGGEFGRSLVDGLGSVPSAPAPRPVERPRQEAVRRLRVGGEVQGANLVYRVNPVYPPLAKQARIQGTVRLEGVIAKDGRMEQLRLISGHPLLAPAALAAVKQWRYRPTHLNGEPVEVVAPIDVHFVISQ
jgi:protein TonB